MQVDTQLTQKQQEAFRLLKGIKLETGPCRLFFQYHIDIIGENCYPIEGTSA